MPYYMVMCYHMSIDLLPSIVYLCSSFVMWYNLNMSKYKGQTPARRKASEKYRTERIDTILVRVPKGQKEIIQKAAADKGVSLNQYIVSSINDALKNDMP